ncbi:hypothetical protein [Goodfellowiella coeruleoviolacea]|uniref:Uncharacterized protein n=1 Tax=Goodfellowiella coeruleoviolacea TaxID=334858 RepID=A0AAE3GK97_9PSEU|nr:hypothetical protein [Goodfellowiella coeruleoviolacea]MCP2169817.1 hypothetical protein [Goodfellowiella coeruleoviolacea]
MDDDAIQVLVTAVAGLVVRGVASGLWHQIRAGLARIFGQGDEDRQRQAEHQLDQAEALLAAAEPERDEVAREVNAEWRGALRTLLAQHPGAADELAALLAATEPPLRAERQPDRPDAVSQRALATGRAQIRQAGRDVTG